MLVGITSAAVVVGTFAFIYAFLPNTKVRFWPSLIGGMVAGGLWIAVGWGFTSFIVGSTKYTAIYSAFAALILFMIWLYLMWLIVLTGGAVSFYAQNPHYINIRRENVSFAITLTEKAALVAVYFIVRGWYEGDGPWTTDRLANEANVPTPVLVNVLGAMEKAGLIRLTDDVSQSFVPARPPEITPIKAVLDAVRNDEGAGNPGFGTLRSPQPIETIVKRIDDAVQAELDSITIKDFVFAPETKMILKEAGM